VSRARYGSIIKHKEFYDDLITKIETTKISMDSVFDHIQELEARVIQVQD